MHEEYAMTNKLYYLVLFGLILAMARIIPHPLNFTPILASAIMAPLLLKDRLFGVAIPIFGMFVADIVLGFHPYQLVIYLTIATIGLVSTMQVNYIKLGLLAVGSSVWFFLTTNFAVWLVWDYYPKSIEGLIMCYTMAIPFFTNTLFSTIIFTGILTIAIKPMEILNEKLNYYIIVYVGNSRLFRSQHSKY